jgi:DNA-binding NarL/FixJ family response regulator
LTENTSQLLEEFVGLLELLNADPQPDVVIDALVQGFLSPFAVQLASLHVATPPDGLIRTIGTFGMSEEANDRFALLDPEAQLPVPHVMRTNRILRLSTSELIEQYPALKPDFEKHVALAADGVEVIFVPVVVDSRPAAVFGFSGRGFHLDERTNLITLQGLAAALSLWLARHYDTWTAGVSSISTDGAHPIALTPRQRAILDLVEQGWTNARIGIQLDCSRSTIKHEMQRIMFALAARNRDEAVTRAREIGLLAPVAAGGVDETRDR